MRNKPNRREMLKQGGAGLIIAAAGSSLITPGRAGAASFDDYYILPPGGLEGARRITEAPHSLVQDGRIRVGVFDAPVRDNNLYDANIFGIHAKNPLRSARILEFIGFGVSHPEVYMGMILIDAQVVKISGLNVYNRNTRINNSHLCFGWGKDFRLARHTWNDMTYVHRSDYSLEMQHSLDQGKHTIQFDIPATRKAEALKGELILHEDLERFQPLVVSLPVEHRFYMYTMKAHVPAEGYIRVGSQEFEIDPSRDIANIDEHRNYKPVMNRWFWGSCSGFDQQGRIIGANFCDNIIKDQTHWNENCIWVGKNISLLGKVHFEVDRKHLDSKPWIITEENNRLELEFTPFGTGEPIDVSLLGFKYYPTCGSYSGWLKDDQGRKHVVDKFFGPIENLITGYYDRPST